MNKLLIIIFYIVTFIITLSFFNKKDNLNEDLNYIIDDDFNFKDEEIQEESIIKNDINNYKKIEDRRHAMLLEQIKNLGIRIRNNSGTGASTRTGANSGIGLTDLSVINAPVSGISNLLYNSSNGVFTYTPPNIINEIFNNSAFNLTASGTNSLNVTNEINLGSGICTLVSLIVIETNTDSVVSGGYIGKYNHSVIKNTRIYSVDHEINNSDNFKCTFQTTNGILFFNNLTNSNLILHVIIKTFNLL